MDVLQSWTGFIPESAVRVVTRLIDQPTIRQEHRRLHDLVDDRQSPPWMRQQVFHDLTGWLVVDLDRLLALPCPPFPDRRTGDLATQGGDRQRLTVSRSLVPPQPHDRPRAPEQPRWIVRLLDRLHRIRCQVGQLAIAGDDLGQIATIIAVRMKWLTKLVHKLRTEGQQRLLDAELPVPALRPPAVEDGVFAGSLVEDRPAECLGV